MGDHETKGIFVAFWCLSGEMGIFVEEQGTQPPLSNAVVSIFSSRISMVTSALCFS